MSRRSRIPGTAGHQSFAVPLCTLHLASCVRVEGEYVCPICMAEHAPALSAVMPNRRARRAVMHS